MSLIPQRMNTTATAAATLVNEASTNNTPSVETETTNGERLLSVVRNFSDEATTGNAKFQSQSQPLPQRGNVTRQFSAESYASASSCTGSINSSSRSSTGIHKNAITTLKECLVGSNPQQIRRAMQLLAPPPLPPPPQYNTQSHMQSQQDVTESFSSSANRRTPTRSQSETDYEPSSTHDDSQSTSESYYEHDHSYGSDSQQPSDDNWRNELVPVTDKWAPNTTNTTNTTNTDCPTEENVPPVHVIALPVLRKLVSAGGLLQTVSADQDDHHQQQQQPQQQVVDPTVQAESYRALAWRVLLGYLPIHTNDWTEALSTRRTWYLQAVARLVHDPSDGHERAAELLLVPLSTHRKTRNSVQRSQSDQAKPLSGSTSSPPRTSATTTTTTTTTVPSPPPIPAALRTYWQHQGLDVNILERLCRDLNALVVVVPNELPTTTTTTTSVVETSNDNETSKPFTVASSSSPTSPTPSNDDDQWDAADFVDTALLLDEIRKDVVRTLPDLRFFLEPTRNVGRRRYAALERILLVWAKQHPHIRYVQGLNEIAGILYYVLANDPHQEWAVWAEADTYGLLSLLLLEMSDVFQQGLVPAATPNATSVVVAATVVPTTTDHDSAVTAAAEPTAITPITNATSTTTTTPTPPVATASPPPPPPPLSSWGIQGRLQEMQALLTRHDPEVADHFAESGIEPSFYAIRWFTTLLSREFLFPDTIRLWDSMFASTHKDNFLRYVCVTMIMTMRDKLLKGDFGTCLRLLHSYPSTSIERLLEASRALWVYESQISVACHRGRLSLSQALQAIASPPALIMAYGFPNGTPPPMPSSSNVGSTASVLPSVSVATVKHAAQGMLGRARGLYHRYSKDYGKRNDPADSASTTDAVVDGAYKDGSAKDGSHHDLTKMKLDEVDDIYLRAILET
jgi:Rab-GTPase-TBC domain